MASLFRPAAAAFAVAGRSASGRITIPLPSQVSTSARSSGAGPGLRAAVEPVHVAAARTASSSTCRFPIFTPVARVIAAAASSYDPRADSIAASFRSPCDCFSPGRFSAASSGCTFPAPGARYAIRVTVTCPNTVASALP